MRVAMFGLGKPRKDPLVDVKGVDRWLTSFNANDPLAMHVELVAELGHVADRDARRTLGALQALFHADAGTRELRRLLTAQYIEHANRSGKIEHQLWQALFDLTHGFGRAYAAFGRDMIEHAQDVKWQAFSPELIARQVAHLGLDSKIRMFRYEAWIPGKWMELHTLYSLACVQQIEHRPITLAGAEGVTTIEQKYLNVLALQLANTGNVTPSYLEWLATQLDEWCTQLRLVAEPVTSSSFYVDPAQREGLRRVSAVAPKSRILYVDTRTLHSRLRQHVLALEQRIKAAPLSSRTVRRVEQLSMLTKIAAQVDGEFRPIPRRGERTSAEGAVDAIVGFTRISGYLREEDRSPMRELDTGTSFSETMELAVFGRVRNDGNRRKEMTSRRLATFAPAGGAWAIRDKSATGFRLTAAVDPANPLTLGMLVALRPHAEIVWTLGVVRRMKRLTVSSVEIGVQAIADTVVGVDLVEQRVITDDHYSVDGESVRDGRPFGALFLALRRRETQSAVQSLVVPASEYHPAKRFRLQTRQSSYPVRFGRLLEEQPDWVWVAVDPLKLDEKSVRVEPAPAG